MRRGVVFTLEALISLLFIVSTFTILIALEQNRHSDMLSLVFLSDVFEVIEKRYHADMVVFVDTGIMSPDLAHFFSFIERETGKRVFLRYGQRYVPGECESSMRMARLVTGLPSLGLTRFHTVEIGLCD